ncbi:hypothetical protein [Candidatus Enterovibrio altilux]|uniref:Uncharacterized protein n=1 Tax=Candidatus Enterovibrio altilux TaxID=1927128 RepID=A0A291B9E3_9GAMM|nr:hypothetical protein [Candidatus Enterovibrio luxaltus]ATF09614.1 hypothetical protein BTN50_1121 [Candidatus Enterovibrio luxaltus]
MKYQAMEFATSDNVMKPFVCNEWCHSPNAEKEQLVKNDFSRVI